MVDFFKTLYDSIYTAGQILAASFGGQMDLL